MTIFRSESSHVNAQVWRLIINCKRNILQKILTDSDDPALLEAVNAEEIPFDFKVGISPFEHIFILTASHKKLIYLQNTIYLLLKSKLVVTYRTYSLSDTMSHLKIILYLNVSWSYLFILGQASQSSLSWSRGLLCLENEFSSLRGILRMEALRESRNGVGRIGLCCSLVLHACHYVCLHTLVFCACMYAYKLP